MWFPNRRKVAKAVGELLVEYTLLQRRVRVWNAYNKESVLAGVVSLEDDKLAAWGLRTETFQENVLDVLREAAEDFVVGGVAWEHLVPVVDEARKNAKLTTGILDKIDGELRNAEVRMRAVWRSQGLLDE